MDKYDKYIDYIKKAGSLSEMDGSYLMTKSYFVEDWEPIGNEVIKSMTDAGLVEVVCNGEMLKLKG